MAKIVLAQPRGFCAGVIRAIDIVDQALDRVGKPVYVRHEIVHNRHVVEKLRNKGAVFVEELDEVPPGEVAVFSAHGVGRDVEEEARIGELQVLDATCPLVRKVHFQGRRYLKQGRNLVLIGHAGHPEVVGTLGQIDGKVWLAGTVEDVAGLPLPLDAPIAYVTQTTLSVDDTRDIISALQARFSDVIGPDVKDICYATQNRQQAVRDLSRVSDMIIVVGAPNSSNSNRLREIGEEEGLPSFLIEDATQLDPAWLQQVEVIGLTAGASAPEELVQGVIDRIRACRPDIAVEKLDGIEEHIEFRLPPELRKLRQPAPVEG
ncbi:4-hydroxy-3-methylbut-2-enyl diphosphate reductase [Sphingomonas vulcanisoli]|uniref:4-hydroxy-3-methylbut-2-enyl diphosphate reductase n=1 Tax=Sphingomonas vulcanisoli TaxID=1658060 RepID=A0ABX0TQP1_9SPHN|nr:4-hydroxy-3-methylbut-2-enyl diphosphate reductase [Sphingomonas vulcanisoli]NIJ07843.1 4-hydroxy-3-methylbut-2-enyl diphosphate reductase [Sphingomonas vulcanisoli]